MVVLTTLALDSQNMNPEPFVTKRVLKREKHMSHYTL